jgi:hypothetical protein
LTKEFFGAKLPMMKIIYRKIIGLLLIIPFLFAITFCCCLDRDAAADEGIAGSATEHHHELERSHHAEHEHDSQDDDECFCPKHFSFLSEQSGGIVFDSSFSQMLAKNLTANHPIENTLFLAALSNHSQDPPSPDRTEIPLYLRISNLRL